MQSFDERGNVLSGDIFDKTEEKTTIELLQKQIETLRKKPVVDKIVISKFIEGEIIEIKGLKFKVQKVDEKEKTLLLELLSGEEG